MVNISRELIIIFKLFSVSPNVHENGEISEFEYDFNGNLTLLVLGYFAKFNSFWPSQVVIKSRPTLSLKDNFDSIGANWTVFKTVENMYIST